MRGKDPPCTHMPLFFEDHPRLCGEKLKSPLVGGRTPGSPPPMRGKGGECGVFVGCTRITPAYAGKRIKKIWNNVKT